MHKDLLQAMFDSYATTALWSSTKDDGQPLDRDYDVSDIAESSVTAMKADCEAFYDQNESICSQYELSDVGHDFWLTRNDHGCGFWDGDYPKHDGKVLTQKSKEFGNSDLYVGDDNLIYVM